MIAVSVDDTASHLKWVPDIEQTRDTKMNFPILADSDRKVAKLYDMIPLPEANDTLTVRSVFIIDNNKKIRATITYPAGTGRISARSFAVIDSLQLTDNHKVATPADWKDGDDCVIVPSITDPAEIKQRFPKGHQELRPYLRRHYNPTSRQRDSTSPSTRGGLLASRVSSAAVSTDRHGMCAMKGATRLGHFRQHRRGRKTGPSRLT